MRVKMKDIWCPLHVNFESSGNLQHKAVQGCMRLQPQLSLDALETIDSMMHHKYQTAG